MSENSITRRSARRRATALGLAVATTTAAAAVTTSAAAGTATAPAVPAHSVAHVSTLPDGDRVTVRGSGAHTSTMVTTPDGSSAPAVQMAVAGHAYVIPVSVIASGQAYDPAGYDTAAPAAAHPAAVTPHYPLSILEIDGIGLDGAAAQATTFLLNTDDMKRFAAPIPLKGGVARVAVPSGNYCAVTVFATLGPAKGTTEHVVTRTDLAVSAPGTTTLTADERTATAQVGAVTPRPSTADTDFETIDRTDAVGATGHVVTGSTGATWVTPQPAARIGALAFRVLDFGAAGPAGPDPYRYDLSFAPSDHIDANQTYRPDPSRIQTTHNVFATDSVNPAHQASWDIGASGPDGGAGTGYIVPAPGRLTDYIGVSTDDVSWAAYYVPVENDPNQESELEFEDLGIYRGPGQTWRTWGRGPLTPQVGQYTNGMACNACVDPVTDMTDFGITEFTDSDPNSAAHDNGPGYAATFSVYRDGVQVATQSGWPHTELPGTTAQPGTYRMVYDADTTGSGLPMSQSTKTHTDITFRYAPGSPEQPTLPADDVCYAANFVNLQCEILPALSLDYQLSTDDSNTSHLPVQLLDLGIGHQSYQGQGSHAAITGATVSVSYDAGKTWVPAAVAPTGDGHYLAAWPNNAPKGSTPWLKVTATDAIGGSISQTVADAYTIG
ncbi:hypothetical protein KGQ19_01170 [Catenulispora sp. NL8]|uniref:Uncharacterized protein n=1 Tax=Catenulispora pinistramenti TaxID=2705254 RepID=A0ABS5KHU6_9ACTN|nr:hypothetical protein [Catenulispora pinistramenti]MBS2545470.1 hypothetical protein [Catenulispora pinistramenti]